MSLLPLLSPFFQPTYMNLSASFGGWLQRQSYRDILIWVAAPKSTRQVWIGIKAKLTLEHTRARRLPFLTCQVIYLGHSFLMWPGFLQK